MRKKPSKNQIAARELSSKIETAIEEFESTVEDLALVDIAIYRRSSVAGEIGTFSGVGMDIKLKS